METYYNFDVDSKEYYNVLRLLQDSGFNVVFNKEEKKYIVTKEIENE